MKEDPPETLVERVKSQYREFAYFYDHFSGRLKNDLQFYAEEAKDAVLTGVVRLQDRSSLWGFSARPFPT